MTTVAVCHADATDGVLEPRDVAEAVAAADRAGGTYWPVVARYSLAVRSAPSNVEPLMSEALHIAQEHRLDFFADALLRANLVVGIQFREQSPVVLTAWRDLVPRLDDLGLYQEENASFYALAEGEHCDLNVGLHLAEHFLARLRTLRCDPLIEAQLRWVVAHLCRLHGDLDRAADSLELADRLARPRFNFLGGLADITRSALNRRRGQPTAAAAIVAGHVQHYPKQGLTDIPIRLLEELATIACDQGRHQDSADLLATATANRRRQEMPLSPACRVEIAQLRDHIDGHIGAVLQPTSVHGVAASLAMGTD
jgi:hypothetical protein